MKQEDYRRVVSGFVMDPECKNRVKKNVCRAYSKRNLLFRYSMVAACALFLIGAAAGTFFWHAAMPANTPPFSGFVLTAYAAGKPGSSVPGQKSDAVQLVPKKELRFHYSLHMNQVPGFPLTLGCREATKKTTAADRIRITVDNGSILLWNHGDVQDAGKIYECAPGTTIYWLPIENNTPVNKQTVLTLTAFKGNREIGTQKLHIQALGGGVVYTVEMT